MVHVRNRISSLNGLPVYSSSSSAVQEKLALRPAPWWSLHTLFSPRFSARSPLLPARNRRPLLLCLSFLAFIFATFSLAKHFASHERKWPTLSRDPSTLIFRREDLQRIWLWEISSGHYPSRSKIPEQIRLHALPDNPALPPSRHISHKRTNSYISATRGTGANRVYLDLQSQPPHVAYPPRPVPGSIVDFDIIMEHCDFSKKKFVRDCLEVLRVGAGLDNGKRLRRGNMDDWKYLYIEQDLVNTTSPNELEHISPKIGPQGADPDSGLSKKRGMEWEKPPIPLPAPRLYQPYSTLSSSCDPENPRLFHMFWTGPFTDKPYLALLSFLHTQNTGLHLHSWHDSRVCRPKVWLWINPGPAAAVPNTHATSDMFRELSSNPWASPFLHPRFKDVIEFKLWNTTEQLDGVPEIRDEWRHKDLFNSLGHIISVPRHVQETLNNGRGNEGGSQGSRKKSNDMLYRTGSKSSSTYDRLSVILSDVSRFILCHRYGGIYLDADTIFLRDWEEVWGWNGAFAYRWSRLERLNTAVLRLNKGSALGKFLFRTALKNGLDFHPMTVSRYLKDAFLEPLLLRLPDALFDPAWLNTENYQMNRPPQPFFTSFGDFFDTPALDSAAPQALGFDGFFRGAFSYHYHNFWWKPFDPVRNWPDLGPRFISGERLARGMMQKAAQLYEEKVQDDKRDLDWATVLKRTCEAYIRGEIPNMYGEWLAW